MFRVIIIIISIAVYFFSPNRVFAQHCCPLNQTCIGGGLSLSQCGGCTTQCCVAGCYLDPGSPGASGLNLQKLINVSMPKLQGASIGSIINLIVSTYLFPAAGIVLFIYLIFGGYQIMFSGGEPKSIAMGKGKITSAIIGFVIMFVSYWIVQIISYATGLGTLNLLFN